MANTMKLNTKGIVLVMLVLAAAAASIGAVAAEGQDRTRDCLGSQDQTRDRLMDGSCGACPCDGTCDGDGLKAMHRAQGN